MATKKLEVPLTPDTHRQLKLLSLRLDMPVYRTAQQAIEHWLQVHTDAERFVLEAAPPAPAER